MAKSVASDYARTYTTFSGCDIVCTFGNYELEHCKLLHIIFKEKYNSPYL